MKKIIKHIVNWAFQMDIRKTIEYLGEAQQKHIYKFHKHE